MVCKHGVRKRQGIHTTAWKRSDALNGAHEPKRTIDDYLRKEFVTGRILAMKKSLMHVKRNDRAGKLLAWTPLDRLSGDHCEVFGVSLHFSRTIDRLAAYVRR